MLLIRFRNIAAAFCLLVCASTVFAQEKKNEPLFQAKGALTEKDPPHKEVPKSYSKTHTIKLRAESGYRIELTSKDFDALLILADAGGKVLTYDDDSGGDTNARVIFRPTKDGEYRLVVTSSLPAETGKYALTVTPATPTDLMLLRVRGFQRLDRESRTKLLEDLIDHFDALGKKNGPEEAQLALGVGSALEDLKVPGAAAWYMKAGKAIGVSENADAREKAVILEGSARRIRLPGNTMALKGTKLDGKALNWESYRGKVVLVDFWATWCGPCIREIPSMRRLYAAYKDKGFDIVAISLDSDYDALEAFLKRNKAFPWVCLFEKDAKRQPLGDYYGVSGIPLPILVDKAGKVVSMDARGPELERLLEQYLGPIPEGK